MSNFNIKGLDVSNYQQNVDFSAVANAGYQVVIIETSDGITFTNPYLEQQYSAAQAAGLKIGFYHFFRAEDNMQQQAQHFWNLIQGKSYDVYPVLDVEVTMGVSNVTDAVLSFINEFNSLSNNQDMIIYTYPGFIGNLDNRLSSYRCWIADYGVSAPCSTSIWGDNYVGWQYTGSGSINGLSNAFDLDTFNDGIFMSSNTTVNYPIPKPYQGTPVSPTAEKGGSAIYSGIPVAIGKPPLTLNPPGLPTAPTITYQSYQQAVTGKIINNLQLNLGMNPTGLFDEPTLEAVSALSTIPVGVVRVIQNILSIKGYSLNCLETSISGTTTSAAINSFQSASGLTANGQMDGNTWSALMKA